ncbi:MAG: TonB-dependent receptor [Rikenellaceae bacterium]|nr:TonB-dependent receptor [Rikenellaceae bacterium]
MKNGLQNRLGRGFLFAAMLCGVVTPGVVSANGALPSTTVSDFIQTKTITGKVVDTKGQPVIGATVIVQNTSRGDITGADGSFSIDNVKVGENIEVAFIGYLTKVVPVGTQTNITVTLEDDALKVEDVVVVGFGTQKKVNLTGAVASVDSEELLKRPVADVKQMLQGAIPGLNINVTTSQPGAESISMNIRGANSFGTSAEPLVLINGVEGSIGDLDPASVESVSVLKDAASASIYGSRAANGVILITTKNGTGTRERVSVTYNMNIGFHKAAKLYDLVTDPVEYMQLKNMAMANSGYGYSSGFPFYTEGEMDLYRNRTDENDPYGKYTGFDWQGYMFRTALVQNHNIGIAGSNETTSYNINLSYMNQEGTMRGYGYKRYNITTAFQAQLKPWLKVGTNVLLTHGNVNNPLNGAEDGYLATLAQAPTYKPWLVDKTDVNGDPLWTSWAFTNEYKYVGGNKNVPAVNANSFRKRQNYHVNAQAFFDANIVKGLTWHTKAAVRYGQTNGKDWGQAGVPMYNYLTGEPQGGAVEVANKGGLTSLAATSLYTNLYTYLRYDYTSKNSNHNFSVMGGYSQEQYDYRYLDGFRRNYNFPLYELNAGVADATRTNSGYSYTWALMSGFGRVNYNFKERYLVEANIRYDGTSRIAKNNRWGVFPSFSVGWRLTEEQFMKDLNLSWLNSVKFRGSWGLLGNQDVGKNAADVYPYQALISTGSNLNYVFDGVNITPGAAQTAANNANLKWETTAIGDFGVDLLLFRGLNITFDWYHKRTYDIIRGAQVSSLLGLSAPVINDGEMVNKGIEFMIGWSDRIDNGIFKDLSYNANFFIARNRNKLVKYGATEYGGDMFGAQRTIFQEGGTYGAWYLLEAVGIYESNAQVELRELNGVKIAPINNSVRAGDIIYRDVDGDGKITDADWTVQDGYYEKFNYSINLGLAWKGFDLSMMLHGRAGRKTMDLGYMGFGTIPFVQGSAPRKDYVAGMWTEENPTGATWPRLDYRYNGSDYKNMVSSTFYLKNSSFLRLKNLTVGYTIPARLTQKIGVQKLRVYFSGDNLATATKFDGLDPERNMGNYGVNYPLSRICSFGVNLQF